MHPQKYKEFVAADGVPPERDSSVELTSGVKQKPWRGPRGPPKGPQIDPQVFGLQKAAYSVEQTLNLLSIGRTSLYAAVKRGELNPVKFGRKTLFYANDIAAFLTRLKEAA
jgi:excisionase family DNA binding protein